MSNFNAAISQRVLIEILELNLLPGATAFAYVHFKLSCLGCSSESLYFPWKIYVIVDNYFKKN